MEEANEEEETGPHTRGFPAVSVDTCFQEVARHWPQTPL